jgi:hypothetical protein
MKKKRGANIFWIERQTQQKNIFVNLDIEWLTLFGLILKMAVGRPGLH